MGLLDELTQLQAHDLEVGHRRYYDPLTFRREIEAAGFRIEREDGVLLKPLSNGQMMQFDSSIIDGLFEVGRSMPRLCAELLIVARHSTDRK